MSTQNRRLITMAAIGLLGMVTLRVSADAAQTVRLQRLMDDKLVHAQEALAGTVTSNWAGLERNARALITVTQSPEWMVLKTPDYERFSTAFVMAADRLVDAAVSHDLDEASLAYADLTVRCVACHRYVQRARLAR